MKHKLILLLLILPLFAFPQEGKFNYSIASGPSFPLGNFAEDNFDRGSFAAEGVTFNLIANYKAFNHLSFGMMAAVNFHSVNAPAMISAEFDRDPFLLDLNIRAEPYRSMQLLAGADYHFYFARALVWSSGIKAGIMEARSAFKIYEADYFLIGRHNYRITHARDYVFSYLAHTGIEYKLKSYFSLLLQTQITHSSVEFGFSTAQGRRHEMHDFFFWNTVAGFKVYF